MRLIVLLSACVLFCSFSVGCTKQGAKVDTAKATARCAKWAKLLGSTASAAPGKCVAGMQRLAAENPKAYTCGNKCIDAADSAMTLMKCMRACRKP